MPILKPFFWGIGAAVLAYMVTPKVKKMARPVIVRGINSTMSLAEKGKEKVEELKDRCREKTQIVEHETESDYDTTIEQMSQEQDRAFHEINEIKDMISRLQSQINEIRQKIRE